MKRLTNTLGVLVLVGLVLAFVNPDSLAGRAGGPLRTTVNVPGGQSVYFEVPFTSGPAIATAYGNNLVYVFMYDSDGHVATGIGGVGYKTARMDVYRPGTLRIEVRNSSLLDQTVTLATN